MEEYIGDFTHLPDPIRYTEPKMEKNPTPYSASSVQNSLGNTTQMYHYTKTTLFTKTEIMRKSNLCSSTEISHKSPCPVNGGLQTGA